ncbi:MAG: hypothetical protein IID63_00615 [candidate division Zixibacteria bacterium]|nr:hypothetical protein [candidate division Zixibacteria bacterium]
MNNQSQDSLKKFEYFINIYNQLRNKKFQFECIRKSMFSLKPHEFENYHIYQVAFLDGPSQSSIINDLKVLFRRRKRLILEVVEPKTGEDKESSDDQVISLDPDNWWRLIEDIVFQLEIQVSKGIISSRDLLIDFTRLGRLEILNPHLFSKERSKWVNTIRSSELSGIALRKEFSMAGMPSEAWFEGIWLTYMNRFEKLTTKLLYPYSEAT